MKRPKPLKWSWRSARRLAALSLGLVLLTPVAAQQQLEAHFRLTGKEITKVFEPIREVLQKSSAVILDDWKSVGYGVVVSSDGHILVKASEIADLEEISVRVDRDLYKQVQVISVNPSWDVALIKVEAEGLMPVTWAESAVPHGTWVVSNGSTSRTRRRVRVGIISANTREIGGAVPVVLGVVLEEKGEDEDEEDAGAVIIRSLAQDGGAAQAGLKEGDILREVEGEPLADREQLLEILKTKTAGETLSLTVERDGEQNEYEVELSARSEVFEEQKTRNDAMSGRTSSRRTSFKRVLQHDIGLSERSVGGPLLDLDGRCVGMNIARSNRAESFAIPATELRGVLGELLQEAK